MRYFWILGSLLLVPSGNAAAHERLYTQEVRGATRVCVYQPEVGRFDSNKAKTLRVGRGEPCPQTYREPEPATADAIPALASLWGEERTGSGPVCIYRYQNRQYRRSLGVGQRCPFPPNLPIGSVVDLSPDR
jgi:hypothetical protein